MPRAIRLRRWQKAALEQFEASPERDFLTVATPGAGKTTFALTAAIQHLSRFPHRRVFVVAPTQHLKVQWARAAGGFGLHLEPDWVARDGFPGDMHGVVVTYQQVAADPRAIRGVADDAFVILDEIHHAGHERAWGDAIFEAFELGAQRLSLSGTPFRSDRNPIPFVTYDPWEEATADYVYGYGEALKDGGVVRPVFFPRINGHMEWSAPDGSILSATFDDTLDRTASNQRLRTALSLEGEWVTSVLDQAHARLLELRAEQRDAGGLVIAMDQEHAQGIAGLMRRRHGVEPVVATSDDPRASDRIAHFSDDMSPWIVAVRMVSEGVDIPRLRVGVFATNTTTELFFRQAVGRLVRWRRGLPRQKAFMFIPDDPRLRTYAAGIGEERKHSLQKRREEMEERELVDMAGREEQMSLFSAISAVALDEPSDDIFSDHYPEDLVHHDEDEGDDALLVALAPPPLQGAAAGPDGLTRGDRKKVLRKANADAANELALTTGMSHAQVNAELNRLSGIVRIGDATANDLDRRLRAANKWLARTGSRA